MNREEGRVEEGRSGALQGLRVVEWAQGFGGPLSARLLGDLGADVVKIEPPEGDWTRRAGLFTALNYNKRAVTLDPGWAEDLASARNLLTAADVVIESNALGYLDALGLGFAT